MTKRPNGKGSYYRKGASLDYYGKWNATVDGVDVRVTRKLGTTNELVAKRLVEECAELKIDLHEHPSRSQQPSKRAKPSGGPAFELAAEQVLGNSSVPNHAVLLGQLRLHVLPHVGKTPVREVAREDVEAVLANARDAGLARATVKALQQGMCVVSAPFYPDAPVSMTGNGRKMRMTPAALASMPVFHKEVRKEYARLRDHEVQIYMAWVHPEARHRLGVRERQTMGALARCFGGVRSGDIHSMKWESLDIADGAFPAGWVPRRKTQKPQKLQIPETLRPVLRAWWNDRGRPLEGLIFPALKGERAGHGEKQGVSHAAALRRDLKAAMQWAVKQEMPGAVKEGSLRWRELFVETETTRPVNFHSFRRSFADAMKRSGVNQQTAKALGGWASAAMDRYLGTEDIALPAGTFPTLPLLSPLETTANTDRDLSGDPSNEKTPNLPGFLELYFAPGAGLEPATIRLTAVTSA